MVIGFLINGRVTSSRIETMNTYYHSHGFNREIIRVIDPTPAQRDEVMGILNDFGSRNIEMMESCRAQHRDLFSEMRKDLDGCLTDIQINRLDRFLNGKRERFLNMQENCNANRTSVRKHRNRR